MRYSISEIKSGKIPSNITGVYFMLNQHDEIIYIGKSIDIKKRIKQHLGNGRERMLYFFKQLKIVNTSCELMALLYESQEIKKHRPIYNRRLRKAKSRYFIHENINDSGYNYLSINSVEENSLLVFDSLLKAKRQVQYLTDKFSLCDKINLLEKTNKSCFKYHLKMCHGACINNEESHNYNTRFYEAINSFQHFPKKCTLEFQSDKLITFVEISNHVVIAYGIKNKSRFEVEFQSNDELRIVKYFSRRNNYKLIET